MWNSKENAYLNHNDIFSYETTQELLECIGIRHPGIEDVFSYNAVNSDVPLNVVNKIRQRNAYQQSTSINKKCSIVVLEDLMCYEPMTLIESFTENQHAFDVLSHSINAEGNKRGINLQEVDPDLFKLPLYVNPVIADSINARKVVQDLLMITEEQELLSKLVKYIKEISNTSDKNLEYESIPDELRNLSHRMIKELSMGDNDAKYFLPILGLCLVHALKANETEDYRGLFKLNERYIQSISHWIQIEKDQLIASLKQQTSYPILTSALDDAKNLRNTDELFIFLVCVISSLPPFINLSDEMLHAIKKLFDSVSGRKILPNNLNSSQLAEYLKKLKHNQDDLPCYGEAVAGNDGFQLIPSSVRMLSDIIAARRFPHDASPSLKGLKIHNTQSVQQNLVSGMRRFVGGIMSDSGGDTHSALYETEELVLVFLGAIPWSLIRKLYEMVNEYNDSLDSTVSSNWSAKLITGGKSSADSASKRIDLVIHARGFVGSRLDFSRMSL